jgi:threonine dehydratase
MTVTFDDILAARQRLQPYLTPTTLEYAPDLGASVYLKLENTNRTHSFKVRGALNAILSLDASSRERGIVTVSSGNHAQGVSYAASLVEVDATILMPRGTPQKKVKGSQRWGAAVMITGDNYDETEARGRQIEQAEGRTFISPYNDPCVIAGAGTVGLEIVEQLPEVGRVVVCVSGGGLISGTGLAVKRLRPGCQVIGVNAESAPAMTNYFYGMQKPQVWDTLAEALSGDIEAGSITLGLARQVTDKMVTVSEEEIAEAMRFMLGAQGWLVEGGGCVGVAAWLAGRIPHDDTPTAIIISGGNIDLSNLRRVLCPA